MSTLPTLDMRVLPPIDLRHLYVLTDDTGILQHATAGTPNLHHGYCTDDNARALIAAVQVLALPPQALSSGMIVGETDRLLICTQRYLAFLAYAMNESTGRFRNFMQYDRAWLEETGSEDSHARTLWALGMAVELAPNDDVRHLADGLMRNALPAAEQFVYLRPWAYALLGAAAYQQAVADDELANRLVEMLAHRLYEAWAAHADSDWPWWEDELTWGNAKLPHAMLIGGLALGEQKMIDAALQSLGWLIDVQRSEDGHLSIIGNQGWYPRGGEMARFDQQPIEAKALVQACLSAAATTGEARWINDALMCFEWFTGKNDIGEPLYNEQTGGGRDGFGPTGASINQGAESTLAYLMSVLALHHYQYRGRQVEGDSRPVQLF
jgi:hypothetical protein